MRIEDSAMRSSSAVRVTALTLTLLFGAIAADRAEAATISLSAGQSALPNIGKVVQSSPTSTGTFRVNASTGVVSVVSGTLTRVSAGSATVPTYTLTCTNGNGGGNACGNSLSSVTVTVHNPVAATAATIAAFNASVALGVGASSCGAIAGQNTTTLSFTCTVVNGNPGNGRAETVATISLGMDISILSVANTGLQNPGYTVSTNP
jgi:hypothetical protein